MDIQSLCLLERGFSDFEREWQMGSERARWGSWAYTGDDLGQNVRMGLLELRF